MNNGHMHFLALFITSDQYVSCFNVIICRPLSFGVLIAFGYCISFFVEQDIEFFFAIVIFFLY
jgi:hypothetical protein